MSDRPVIGQRLKEFQQREVERILGACTQCGRCYEVCPMAQYSSAPSGDSKAVVGATAEGRSVTRQSCLCLRNCVGGMQTI